MVTSFSQPKAASSRVSVRLVRTVPPLAGPVRVWPPPPKPPPPKPPAEEGAKEVPDVAHVKAAEATGSASPAGAEVGVDARKAKLVVLGPLVLVGQHLIGFVDLFKAGLRLFVPGFRSGWFCLASFRYAFFNSSAVAFFCTPKTS